MYKVISARYTDELERLVCSALREGWVLQGGVSTCVINTNEGGYDHPAIVYLQALTKKG